MMYIVALVTVTVLLILAYLYWYKYKRVPDAQSPKGIQGRYVKVMRASKGCLNIADISVLSSGVNVALKKPVVMSSGWSPASMYPGSSLVDGLDSTFAHTSCQDAGSMTIDLGQVYSIDSIQIQNRRDCCNSRLNGSIVSVLSDAQSPIWISDPITDKAGNVVPTDQMTGFDTIRFTLPATGFTGQ